VVLQLGVWARDKQLLTVKKSACYEMSNRAVVFGSFKRPRQRKIDLILGTWFVKSDDTNVGFYR
jgi:hypothetical protein